MTMCILVMNESDEPLEAEAHVEWNDDPTIQEHNHDATPPLHKSPLTMGALVFGTLCAIVFGVNWMLEKTSTTNDEELLEDTLLPCTSPKTTPSFMDAPHGLYEEEQFVRRRTIHHKEP
jgi:hypothetical protein